MRYRLGRDRIATRWLKALTLLLPIFLLALLLLGLSQRTLARPTGLQGENLVPNPGFEQPSPSYWYNTGTSGWKWWCRWSGSEFHEGSHSVEIGSNRTPHQGQWWSDPFTVTAGQQYDFSSWIRAEDVSNGAFLTLAFYSSPTQENPIAEFHSAPVIGSSNWISVTSSAVAPGGAAYARVHCQLWDEGTVWFDDIFVGHRLAESPILGISKSDSPDPVEPGQKLVHTIIYSNSGNVSAMGVLVTDTYDVNTSFHSADPPPKLGSSNRIWEIASLGPRSSGSIVVTLTVNSPLTNGLTLRNRVEMGCAQTAPVSATTTTRVTSAPHLTIAKEGSPEPVEPGSTLLFTITYGNNGTAVATGVDIADTLPVSVNYVSASIVPTTFLSVTNTLVWKNLGNLDVGTNRTIVVTTTVSDSARRGDYLCNQAWIGCREGVLADVEECTLVRPILVSIAPEYASRTAPPGQTACYTHTVYLTGTQPYTVSQSAISSHGWMTDVTPLTMYLQPGDLRNVRACVSVPTSCTVTSGTVDVLTVTANLVDSPGQTVIARDTTTVERALPEIPVTSVPCSAANCSGQSPQGFAFAHQVANTGNYTDTFEIEVVADCCPKCLPGLTGVSPTSQLVGACQSFPITVSVTITPEHQECWAKVRISSLSYPMTRTDFVDDVEPARVGLVIEPGAIKTAGILSVVTLTHLLTNTGNCSDTITLSPSSSSAWPLEWRSPGPLAPGASAEAVVSVTVPCGVLNGALDTVVITATSSRDPSKMITVTDKLIVEASSPEPNLMISQSDRPDPVEPGQELVYTITYSNASRICGATQTVITNSYDTNVLFGSANPVPKPDTDNRVWEIGSLGAQAGGSIVVTVTVNSPLTNGLVLQNWAQIGCTETDVVSTTTTTKVTSLPDLHIAIGDNPDPVERGGRLVYTITYSNTGTDVARETVITDILPVYVNYESASMVPTTFTSALNTLVWEIGSLRPPTSDTIVVTVTVSNLIPDNLILLNRAEIDCAQTDSITASTTTGLPYKVYLPIVLKNYQPPFWYQGSGLPLTTTKSVAACSASPKDIVYAGIMNTGVYTSATGGESWKPEAGVNTPATLGLAVFSDCQTAYAATWGGGVYKRNSATWVQANNGLTDMYLDGAIVISHDDHNRLYLGTPHGVWISTNGGMNWQPKGLSDKQITSLFIAQNAPYTITAGTQIGTVFRSMDGGNTWSEVGSGLPRSRVRSVIETLTGQLYVGLQDKGLYQLRANSWQSVICSGGTNSTIYKGLEYVKGNLYIATYGKGVYSMKNDICEPFNVGLDPLPKIYMMSSTPQRLYIAASSGVWWYPLP